ncbi:hypothetical protein Psuf_018880 [Phytohabitans suffuscus]|uniref:Carrier domain-containing protein n=1 Tax=Phytohabitans suffuscus TaxID=624315 RepID=A0A6F8YEM9_9ACTN|nr:SDR family NAD(P)-dependent oxidoreductase [Phytohabitans suffuscus]BCB84575.1 hypothetical protein Psuf_018880 [Phytohabitans suffuscus]
MYEAVLAELSEELHRITGTACDLTAPPAPGLAAAHLFAHQAAATRVWATLGIRPDVVLCPAGGVVARWAYGGTDTVTALRLAVEQGDQPSGATGTDEPSAQTATVVDVLGETDPGAVAARLVAAGYVPVALRPVAPAVGLPAYPWEHKPYWRPRETRGPVVLGGTTVSWVLSADSAGGLRTHARQVVRAVRAGAAPDLRGVARTLAGRRAAGYRAVATGTDLDALVRGVEAVAAGREPAVPATGEAPVASVLVFPGQGWQWPGMGRELLARSPVFADTVAECAEVVRDLAGWSLPDVLRAETGMDRAEIVQPAMFAVMVGLARVWQSLGLEPAAVVGHSQGEIAAACVAGVLDLAVATRVVVERSAAIRELTGHGAMLSVAAGADHAAALLPHGWTVAAHNGPRSTVVCGPAAGADELIRAYELGGVRARRIPVDYASHSAEVERIRSVLAARLGAVPARPGRVPLLSTVTGAAIDGATMDAAYWYENLRRPVRFQPAIEALVRSGHTVFVECSAHPVLTPAIEETLDRLAGSSGAQVLPTLHRDDDVGTGLHTAAAAAWSAGVPVHWDAFLPETASAVLAGLDQPGSQEAAEAGRDDDPTDAVDRGLWRSVEQGDAGTIVASLGLDGDRAAVLAEALPALAGWRRRVREQVAVAGWRHQVRWSSAPLPDAAAAPGPWLVAVARGQLADPYVVACCDAVPGAQLLPVGATDTRDSLAGRLRREAEERAVAGVLSLLALDETPDPRRPGVPAGLLETAVLLQALEDAGLDVPLWAATRGAVAAAPGDTVTSPGQALVAGLVRTAGVEHPQRRAGLVDLPEALDQAAGDGLRGVLAAPMAEDQVAVRGTGLWVPRLAAAPPADMTRPLTWKPAGTMLITGGTGALGAHVARWLARRGAPHLLLLSRRGPDAPGAEALGEELAALGTRVTTIAGNVADPADLAAAIAGIPAEYPLTGVFHTAGVVDGSPVTQLSADQLEAVLEPKVAAVRALHEATSEHALSAFVLFSSVSGLVPHAGQGAYAAANAHLDAFAQWRRAAGLPALAVLWGTWAGAGMATSTAVARDANRGGLELMTAHLAVTALHQALDNEDTSVLIADVAWNRLAGLVSAGRPPSLLADLVDAAPAAVTAAGTGLAERLRGLPRNAQLEEVLTVVCAEAATVLGHAGARDVPPEAVFRDLGFDSVTGLELRNRLGPATGVRIPATAVFDHPTPAALAGHLLELLAPAPPEANGAAEPDRLDSIDVADLVRSAQRLAS